MLTIGRIGSGGIGLNSSHIDRKRQGTMETLFKALREELDELYAKLNGDSGVSGINYGSDDGLISTTPHNRKFSK